MTKKLNKHAKKKKKTVNKGSSELKITTMIERKGKELVNYWQKVDSCEFGITTEKTGMPTLKLKRFNKIYAKK